MDHWTEPHTETMGASCLASHARVQLQQSSHTSVADIHLAKQNLEAHTPYYPRTIPSKQNLTSKHAIYSKERKL